MSLRFKQIGIAFCLMVSLLIGDGSACTCSHHDESADASENIWHHSDGSVVETAEAESTENAVDDDCTCAVDQRPPVVVSKPETDIHTPDNNVVRAGEILPDLEFAAVSSLA